LAQVENALPNQFLYLKVVNFEVSTMSQDSPEQGTLKILVVDDGLNPLLIVSLLPCLFSKLKFANVQNILENLCKDK
jgi:hypothetical protein